MECKRALEESKDFESAVRAVRQKMCEARTSEKPTSEGQIFSYVHGNGRVGALVQLHCATDFAGRSEPFQKFGRELAVQAVAAPASTVETYLGSPYMRDSSKTVADLVNEASGRIGEAVTVTRLAVFTVGMGSHFAVAKER